MDSAILQNRQINAVILRERKRPKNPLKFEQVNRQIHKKSEFTKFCFPFSAFRFPLLPSF